MYHLQVLTPEKIFFDGEVVSLIAAGAQGYLGILTNHAPLMTSLKAGILVITDKHYKRSFYKASSGFLEVSHNQASIIVEEISPTQPVDIGIAGGI